MIDEAQKLFITAFKRAALVSASIGGGIAAAHLLARSDQHDVLSVFVFLLMIGAFIGLLFRRRRGISALALLFTLGVAGSPVTSLRDDYLKKHDPAEYTRVVAVRAARAVQAEKEDAEQARQAAVVAEAKREAAAEKKIEQARLSDLIGRSVVTEHRRGGASGPQSIKVRVPRRLTRTELVGLTRALNRQYTKGAFNDHGLIAQFYVPPAPKDRGMLDWSWVAKVKLYPSGSMRVIADGESVVVDS